MPQSFKDPQWTFLTNEVYIFCYALLIIFVETFACSQKSFFLFFFMHLQYPPAS